MDVERETIIEAAVSIAAVLFFIAVVYGVGTAFGTDGNVTDQGGLALVGAIVLFVVVMAGVGYWLSGQEF